MANTIKIKSYTDIQEEFIASSVITPGMIVEVTSAGRVQPHSGAGKDVLLMVAIEDALQGKGINDNYAVGDLVRCWLPRSGDIFNALLRDEENIIIGEFLESDGEGRLRKDLRTNESWESADANPGGGQRSVYTQSIVGQAIEAKDLSVLPEGSESSAGGAYHNPRILVRVR